MKKYNSFGFLVVTILLVSGIGCNERGSQNDNHSSDLQCDTLVFHSEVASQHSDTTQITIFTFTRDSSLTSGESKKRYDCLKKAFGFQEKPDLSCPKNVILNGVDIKCEWPETPCPCYPVEKTCCCIGPRSPIPNFKDIYGYPVAWNIHFSRNPDFSDTIPTKNVDVPCREGSPGNYTYSRLDLIPAANPNEKIELYIRINQRK